MKSGVILSDEVDIPRKQSIGELPAEYVWDEFPGMRAEILESTGAVDFVTTDLKTFYIGLQVLPGAPWKDLPEMIKETLKQYTFHGWRY